MKKMIFKFLNGINDTAQNLKDAAAGENEEWSSMYKRMEKDAREEGFDKIAEFFHEVAEVEEHHEKRYLDLLKRVEDKTVFVETETGKWKCRNCGYVHEGKEAPKVCPCCLHPQAHFERLAENY